jgi:hypothetical protein
MVMKAHYCWISLSLLLVALLTGSPLLASEEALPDFCARKIRARVVALDQVYFWNRLGAVQPQGMIYALRDDVVHVDQDESSCDAPRLHLKPGQVRLRAGKRPRPLVLRMNAGDCLEIDFENLLSHHPTDEEQPRTRAASVHVVGLQAVHSIKDMGMDVGANGSAGDGVVPPGGKETYTLYAEKEGTYVMYSGGALAGGEGLSGSISAGLFGAVHVEPRGSEWYRSQVTRKDLDLASVPFFKLFRDHPVIDYNAIYHNRRDPDQCWRRRGTPILKILSKDNEIVHTDLTAIITGPGAGRFPAPDPPSTGLYPTRDEPFREFTIIFHDEIGAVQAFPHFEQPDLEFTLHSVRDAFAINYGTGGAGAEILANRLGVGPMSNCPECKYEEFFLSSWVVGDPAMVVDVPANAPCTILQVREGQPCKPGPGPKATKAFFPDDPSNVYHSYLNDRVKFRNLHAGSDDHHIFHLHAHQWTHTAASDESSYLDSQAIGQGASFTYEIAYGGSGNRNKTVGDAIFHCHFYPHFAQGMWSLWRVHDVFEQGTRLDADGRPAPGSRALPDGEIRRGTPIPAVVPLPTLAMALLPGKVTIAGGQPVFPENLAKNPGYPFFIPGRAGHRPPHPPLDTIDDGGLPRHIAVGGEAVSVETRLNFSKDLEELDVEWLNEQGEEIETLAMSFHAKAAGYSTPTPRFSFFHRGRFRVNGKEAVRGAPFADPCEKADGSPVPDKELRVYKAADIQTDAVFNKAGWHFPQQRLLTLWEDVAATLDRTRPLEPLFIRAASGECVEYQLTNLVPNVYLQDDFQVLTPTDILGQHIHLVKFDVTSSDGSGNGWNYEDGSFSPDEVRERIHAIRAGNGCDEPGAPPELTSDLRQCPVAVEHPFFKNLDRTGKWMGAQTTVQRWWADPIPTTSSESDTAQDRTMRTVFTHDHFGPSTHQQTGLYAGLLIEPADSTWLHNETGCRLSTARSDGGPTSWQAQIITENQLDSYREFAIAFADFQPAYEKGSLACPVPAGQSCSDFPKAINPPGRELIGPPKLYRKPMECPDHSGAFPPCPEAVSADDPGLAVVNYRNEPLALRIKKSDDIEQASGEAGDLSYAYSSRIDRSDDRFDEQPRPEELPPLTQFLRPGDPATPLMQAKEGDRVRVRVLVGAHEEEHVFSIHGLKWLTEPDDPASGFRNAQMMGLSEWFDFDIPRVPTLRRGESADFLYKPASAAEWQWSGAWGLLRVYKGEGRVVAPASPGTRTTAAANLCLDERRIPREFRSALPEPGLADSDLSPADALPNLPSNPDGQVGAPASDTAELLAADEAAGCHIGPRLEDVKAPDQRFHVVAVAASEALAGGRLVYNGRASTVTTVKRENEPPGEPATRSGPLSDPTAILFVQQGDLDWVETSPGRRRPRLKAGLRPEPLILRAKAGECIEVTLENLLPESYVDQEGWNALPMLIEGFNANDVVPSQEVGLHAQLVDFNVLQSDGANVGCNGVDLLTDCIPGAPGQSQTAKIGETRTYYWYAGHVEVRDQGGVETLLPVPVEFGAIGLTSSDPIKHTNKGAVGALIIEPEGSSWPLEHGPRPSAKVTLQNGETFREFVAIFQDNINLRYADNAPVESLDLNEDATESGQKAINYRTDPIWFRIGLAPDTPTAETRNFRFFDRVLTNDFIGGLDPETPVFEARKGEAIRFRVVHPGGHTQSHVFEAHGHSWQELPYIVETFPGETPSVPRPVRLGDNPKSEIFGTRGGHGPTNHFDVLIRKAGGEGWVAGDYLIRDYPPWLMYDGIWGILRVLP